MPQVVGLRCPHCAAALDVEVGAASVKCRYCGTTSMLQRGGTIAGVPSSAAAPRRTGLVGCLVVGGVMVALSVGLGVWLLASVPAPMPPSVVQRAVAEPPELVPAVPVPRVEPPVRKLERIDTGRRPLLVDVNKDAHPDILALTDFSEGPRRWTAYAAHDSHTGAILWTVDVADDERRGVQAVVAHDRLILLTDKGQLHGHDLRTGASQWSTALGERGRAVCASKSADAVDVMTIDDRVLEIDTRSGRQTPVAARTDCGALPTDHEPDQPEPTDRADRRAPADTLAIRCGGSSVYTSGGLTRYPDQCRRRSGVDVDNLAGLVAHSLWQSGDGWLVLGVRKPGTYVPMVGRLDRTRKLAWKAEVPEGNPLLADQGGPDPVVLLGDRVIVGYTVKGQPPHLTAFALADGARQWHIDVPGGARVQRAAAADGRVFLYGDGAVSLIDPADGAHVRTIGKAAAEAE